MSDTFLNPIDIAELGATPPTPPSGYQRIYAKADGKIYARNASGEEVILNNVDINLSGNTQGNTTFANNSSPITIVGGNNVSVSGTNKSIVINVPSQTVDTNKAGTGFTSAGNVGLSGTLGTNGLSLSATVRTDYASSNHTHGAVAFSGTNVSASFTSASNGLSIQLSGNPAQTVDTNKAGTGFTSAGNNIGLSGTLGTNGLSLSASVSAQSQQTQNIIQQVIAGTQTKTAGTLSFANSNGISFGMSGSNTITASYTVPTQTTQSYNLVAAGTQTANTTGTVVFSNSNNVSFGMTNNSIVTASFNQTVDTNKAGTGFTSAGNVGLSGTLGTNGLSLSATVRTDYAGTNFAGTNASGTVNTNGVSVSVNAQSVQTQSNVQGISAGTQVGRTGDIAFVNSNGISFGMSNSSQITASYTVPTQTVQSYNLVAAGTQTANTSGTVVFSNSNNVTFGMSNNSVITASVTFNQTSDTNKAGTNFAGTNVSGTLNSNGLSLSVANPSGGGGVGIADTAGTVTNGTVLFSNSNNVSFGLNTALSRITASFSQSADTNKAGTGVSSSTVAGVNVLGTLNTNGLSLGVPNFITTAAQTDHTHGAVAFSGTNVSASFTSASNGLSIQLSAPAGGTGGGGGVAIAGGTNTQTSGTVNFSNSNGVSFGLNTNGVMTAAGNGAIAAGSQTATQGTVSFVNSNGVSFGMSGSSQITAQIAPHTYTLIGNTVGNSTVTGANFVLSGGNNITLSGTNNTIVISAAAGGGGGAPLRSYIEINQGERLTTIRNFSETVLNNRPAFFPFWMDGTGLVANTVRFFVSGVASSNRSLGVTLNCGLYSQVNTSQMSLLTSGSISYSITNSADSGVWNGIGVLDITGMNGFTATAEGRYALALQIRPVSANATWANMLLYGCDNYPNFAKIFSGNTTAATNSTNQLLPWQGVYSTTSAGLPSTVGKTQIYGGNSASAIQPYAVIMGI